MSKFRIGLLTVLLLIGLRLALGCHFLYEGIWKIKRTDFLHQGASEITLGPGDAFTAEPFLTQAKGPIAWLFYAMVPDINGRQRLQIEKDVNGKMAVNADALVARWNDIRQQFLAFYNDTALNDSAKNVNDDFANQLKEYFDDNVEGIAAYFGSLDRFEGKTNDPHSEKGQEAPFQKKRNWDRMMELRQEADVWIKDIETQEMAYKNALYAILTEEQKERGNWPPAWNPLRWSQMQLINFAVTFGLTAIGVGLILGLCSRLAALGGAAFMCFVVMTQPAFPTIYPPDPAILGHALLINKDFIEMMALLVIASVPAGRWGGLDFFLYRIYRAIFRRRSRDAADLPL